MQVDTGPGPGFRFDNNLKKHYSGRRAVYMSVGSEGGVPNSRTPFEIDFRFDLEIGLDLGSLPVGGSGTVAALLIYDNGQTRSGPNDQIWGALIFGDMGGVNFNETTAESNPDDHDNHVLAEDCVTNVSSPIKVTRTGATRWTLASNDAGLACRFAMTGNGGAECTNTHACNFSDDDIMPFKFQFDLVQQD